MEAAKLIPRFCSKLSTLKTILLQNKYIVIFLSTLELLFKIEKVTTHVTEIFKKLKIADGRSPVTIAAAALYFASHAYGINTSKA